MNPYNTLQWPNRTTNNLFLALDRQHTCSYILLPYNYHFHWIVLVIQVDFGMVMVLDPKREPTSKYQTLIDYLNRAWRRFMKKHRGVTKYEGDLYFNTDFPSLRQEQGNNLCGYYAIEFFNTFVGPNGQMTPRAFEKWEMKEDLIEEAKFLAIQEQLCGFLIDEVINPKGEFYCDHSVSIGLIDPNKDVDDDKDINDASP
ncbi:unnamed protein product [Urochloa humidicola]